VNVLVKRLGTVIRVTCEGDQHQPKDKDCVVPLVRVCVLVHVHVCVC
jgi:hypothetical protein